MSGLVLEGISKRFNTVAAVDHVDLAVPNGTFVCMLGPSGCGKTTLLRTIAGLEEPTSAVSLIDGRDITKVPAHQRDFGMVPVAGPVPASECRGECSACIRGVGKADQAKRVEELLALVDLRLHRPARIEAVGRSAATCRHRPRAGAVAQAVPAGRAAVRLDAKLRGDAGGVASSSSGWASPPSS